MSEYLVTEEELNTSCLAQSDNAERKLLFYILVGDAIDELHRTHPGLWELLTRGERNRFMARFADTVNQWASDLEFQPMIQEVVDEVLDA